MAGERGVTAMVRRKWDPYTKAAIVLEGLKGRPVPKGNYDTLDKWHCGGYTRYNFNRRGGVQKVRG